MSYEAYKNFYEKRDIHTEEQYNEYCDMYNNLKEKYSKENNKLATDRMSRCTIKTI